MQRYHSTIVRRAGELYHNFDDIYCLLVLAYMTIKKDRMFYLIIRPELWHIEPKSFQAL